MRTVGDLRELRVKGRRDHGKESDSASNLHVLGGAQRSPGNAAWLIPWLQLLASRATRKHISQGT